jgi:uncharacterized membrane protein
VKGAKKENVEFVTSSDRMIEKLTKFDFLLISICLFIGLGLRFLNLDAKPPASIEIASLGFSLGHGFLDVAIDRLISLPELLAPLQFDLNTTPKDTLRYLMSESTHPPLYFLLNYFWLKLRSPQNELELLHAGRSLSALFGVAAIPASFGLGFLAFRSRLAGHFAAALMAVSPYGIYISQEARHYTLTVLWIIASLCCLIVAVRCIDDRKTLPIWILCVWVVVNSLGIATHYFFSLTLCAEGLVITGFWLKCNNVPWNVSTRIFAAAAGTLVGCLVWLPYAKTVSGNEITEWITTSLNIKDCWEPIARLLGWLVTMVFLLPVEGVNSLVIIVSGVIILTVLVWVLPVIVRAFRSQIQTRSIQMLGGFFLVSIALFLVLIYVLRRDLSLAARYHFVYFPAVIVLLGSVLAFIWNNVGQAQGIAPTLDRRQKVIAILLLGLFGALTVSFNYGFQKSKRADLLVDRIVNTSKVPVVIATTYKTHSEIRELMTIAFEFQRSKTNSTSPRFLLARKNQDNSDRTAPVLTQILKQNSRPLDLWTTNLQTKTEDIEALNCQQDSQKIKIKGYRSRLYHCS